MVVALAGWVWQNHLHATVGGVVSTLAFLPKHVADAVGICFIKLQSKTKMREKERDCEFEGEDSKACEKRGRNGGEVVGETKTLSYIKWVVAGRFPLWNIELLAGTCCSSVAKPQTAVTGLWIMWLLPLSPLPHLYFTLYTQISCLWGIANKPNKKN